MTTNRSDLRRSQDEACAPTPTDADAFQHAALAAGVAYWDLDLATGLVRRSGSHDQIFGHAQPLSAWRLQETVARFLPEERESVIEAFDQALRRGSIEFEKPIQRAGDQAIRWIHIKGRAYSRDGKPAGLAGIVSDVTGSRQLEEKQRQMQTMHAIGQLAREMVHELNNLFMVVGGSLELLGEHIGGDERARRLLAAMDHGMERGAALTQRLMAFSQPRELDIKAICVDELVSSSADLLRRTAGPLVSVEIASGRQMWRCSADSRQLLMTLLNLLDNAREAMPEGGSVTLSSAAGVVDEDAAAAAGASPGEYVVISVADTGAGIAPEHLARVREPFFTTQEHKKGRGLGLSQAYAFASQYGGFVTIESALGRGTTVAVHLPRTGG